MGATASTPATPPPFSEKSQSYSHASSNTSSPASAADLLASLSLRAQSQRGGKASPASATITSDSLASWEQEFASNPKHKLASTVLSKTNFSEALVSREAQRKDLQVFNTKLSTEGNPVTNQKSSGRCWLFSSTNYIRILMARKYNLDEFQLSQSYVFFYDSLAKANYFLEQMLDLADSDLDDRLVQHLLKDPEGDGGQWDMIVNLFNTYGLVPQSVFPESFNSSATGKIDALLTSKLREYSLELRGLYKQAQATLSSLDKNDVEKRSLAIQSARKRKEEAMEEVYRILAIALGQPPKPDDKFTWQYYSKDGKYHELETTPLEFYHKYSLVDVSSHLSLVNDPRHAYESLLEVDRLGNVWGGQAVRYINADINVLKETAVKLLQKDIPVWFGCDVGKYSSSTLGIMDTSLFSYEEGFGISLGMSKAARLATGESAMTHAMLLTGVHVDSEGKAVRFRVENSWGPDACDKGYMVMSAAWFDEFVYQIVAEEKYVPKALVELYRKNENVTHLPPWDPMGTLA